ncbi:SOS response-associated peptidase family protein [Terriglobus sp. TAA 43]|uniref:SOS response-associated peptidase family protein n=1 Tax=Terriglobus sp. TAA 43 TaxID=278961 RepID=UPI0009FCFC48|nr:SOS response-associated peptidase family protein [Terriglobus sp. TAA 43]
MQVCEAVALYCAIHAEPPSESASLNGILGPTRKKPKWEFTIPGQRPFGMAAVWKLWKNPTTEHWEKTFAVLTGEPNELMAPIHDRMTTFLEPKDYEEYLSPSERAPVHLLRILSADRMKAELVDASPISNAQVSLFESQ